MFLTTMIAQFVKIWNKNSNYIREAYNILDNKIRYFIDIYYTVTIKQSQFYAMFSSILMGQNSCKYTFYRSRTLSN